jgi:KRAB domain-containing zinc finger protein
LPHRGIKRRKFVRKENHSYSNYCTQCDYACDSRHAMDLHEKGHKGVTYPCLKCGKSFSRPSGLVRHTRNAHDGVRDHVCSVCAKAFATAYDMQMHVKAVHNLKKDFRCEHCTDAFKSKAERRNHVAAGKTCVCVYKMRVCV